MISDGLACFTGVITVGASHERTVTGGGAASVKLQQFHAVNTLLSNLKTSFSRTYHAFDFAKYGQRYLAEVQYQGCPIKNFVSKSTASCHSPSLLFCAMP